jgi:tRNA threonylcarbamoyladenosine biosynthesis protein TsaB
MKPILAIETSTPVCSIALAQPAETPALIHEQCVQGTPGHAQSVLPLIDAVLAKANISRHDLGLVAFGQGPGAFTGIRLGCSMAQSIAYALDLPLVPVNSLLAVAAGFAREQPCLTLVALDARMDEIYFAVYGPGLKELQSPILIGAADIDRFIAPRLYYWRRAVGVKVAAELVGQGWQVVSRCLPSENLAAFKAMPITWRDEEALPTARHIASVALSRWQAGQTVAPERALPLYLRDKVAFTTAERKQGSGGNPKVGTVATDLVLPMSTQDLSAVVELELQSQAFPWSQRNFEDALSANYPAWVVRREGQLIGFCVAMPALEEVHVLVIAVASDARRGGVGSMLLSQVERHAEMWALGRVLLEVRPSNKHALAFYAQQSFTEIGRRKGYYPAARGQREDAIVMSRRIGET